MQAPDDLGLLVEAAAVAGAEAMRHFRRRLVVWEKPGGEGPVTEADIAVNAALERHLRAARPGYGWLSEETPDTPARLACARCFIVDPIDGTRAFVAGEDRFAISLAVAERGRVVAAAVLLPARDTLYAAAADGIATLNGAPVAVSTATEPNGARILTSAAALAPEHWPGGVPALRRSFSPSLAGRLCLVAEGRHDGMMTLRDTWEWDVAAGALIAERAGATVTDRSGAPLRFNAPKPQVGGVLAAPGALHRALRARMTNG